MGFLTKKDRRIRTQPQVARKKLVSAFVLGVSFLVLDVALMVTDPVYIITKYMTRVDYGTAVHEALVEEFVAVNVAAYLFNVTNAHRFQAGLDSKLSVEEVGPFTYQEIRKNEQFEIDLDSKLLRYSPNLRTRFLPEQSVARPEDVNITMPNLAMLLYDKKAKYILELSADNEDKFSIRTVNNARGLDKWGYNDPKNRNICNSFTNTYEGIGYPPEMTSKRSIRIYRAVLCRILELDYHGTTMTPYGVEGLEYRISNKTYRRNEDTECLCSYGNCIEGVSDLSPCFLGLPVVLSNAHFLHADPKLYERIEGMKPDEKRHGSSFVIEPKVGIAMHTQFSVQVSLLVRDVKFNAETSSFSDLLVPIVYFKIVQPPLVPKQVHYLDLIYFIGPRILLGIQILLALLALALLGYSLRLMVYWNWIFLGKKRISLYSDLRGKSSVQAPLMR